MQQVYKACINLDVSDGLSIHDKLTTAAWCGRDLPQMNAIVNTHIFFTEMKVIANKQHAATTRVEQQVDVAKVFVIFKQKIRHILPLMLIHLNIL